MKGMIDKGDVDMTNVEPIIVGSGTGLIRKTKD
jgi:hypothetical protein